MCGRAIKHVRLPRGTLRALVKLASPAAASYRDPRRKQACALQNSHSYLNARTGLSLAALRAGIQQASSPAAASAIATIANVIGSRGETLNKSRAIN